jgi:hypoxanthine phosphoribosyltransferase
LNGTITIADRQFKPFINQERLSDAVREIARKINHELADSVPVFLVVLNGSFMFASDLLKEVTIDCEISFIRMASYHGTSSSGAVLELIGLTEDLEGRTVVIVEDIVDSGATVDKILEILARKKAGVIKIATALFKPAAFCKDFSVDYRGIEIGNDFVVGYGMDYLGKGRNLKEIFVLA